MAKKKYVVRVAIPRTETVAVLSIVKPVEGGFLECLRYAGIVTIHTDNEERQVFDIHAPAGTDTQTWAEMNASRMQSFGYNAVCAPSTEPVVIPVVIEVDRPDVIIPGLRPHREQLQDELREIEGSMTERTPAQILRHKVICRILAESKCRNCGTIYDCYKSRADLQGFCSAKCQHERAKHHGYRPNCGKTEYQKLKDADDIGSVWVCK